MPPVHLQVLLLHCICFLRALPFFLATLASGFHIGNVLELFQILDDSFIFSIRLQKVDWMFSLCGRETGLCCTEGRRDAF